ncbi:PilW family protein [Legionella fallonii]|uniref:Tfp pilus assembly protein PilW n=1 Tax=Legionella fallonii LLAP-10 TaxID=1212491 RepID=A0A098G503_9GAMM|nr:hypothetical protein [Legionella fallonii]CEG57563.1 conserved protein of unknown function [Legionella fallonii LLAP-10]
MSRQSGVGLPEVLISLFLTAFILTTLTQFYLNNKRQYLEVQKQLEEHLDVQWVRELLSDSIRRAGFTPCLGITQLKAMDRRNFKSTIAAIKIATSPQSLIQINRMSEQFTKIITVQSPTQLRVANGDLFKESHPVLIADCEHAEIHQILRVDKRGNDHCITLTKPLIFSYAASTYIGEWFEEQWFIKPNAKKVNALYYKLFQVEELTSLTHSLQINQQQIQEKQLVEIVMGLANHKTEKLVVAVRGS